MAAQTVVDIDQIDIDKHANCWTGSGSAGQVSAEQVTIGTSQHEAEDGAPKDKEPVAPPKATDVYEVVVDETRAGMRFDGNIIQIVNKYSALYDKLWPDSLVLKVNKLDVNYDTFENIYFSTPLPMTLTLEHRQQHGHAARISSSLGEEAKITTWLLINFLLHYFSVFIDFFGVLVIGPVMPFLMEAMGFNEAELGLLVSIYNAASIPGSLICGWLTSRFGTRTAMLYSLLGSALSLLASGALIQVCLNSDDPKDRVYYNMFLVIRVIGGLTGSSMPVTMTFIGMKCPQQEKPKYMAMASVCLTLAVMVGPMVGGTLSNFTPRFALPFYTGGIVALVGFLIALCMLGSAQPPSRKGKQHEPMSKPLVWMIVTSLFIQAIYGAYIVMGVAYYMWRFDTKPEEAGSILSLHGIIQSANNVFLVPRLMKRMGQGETYMLGCFLMVLGTAIVGFMGKWWAFQIFCSPIVGLGFSCVRTGTSVICDRLSNIANKPTVNASIFSADQIGLFTAGIFYGFILKWARDADKGYFFWLPVSGISVIFAFCYCVVWRCSVVPHERQKKTSEDKAQLAMAIHQRTFTFADEDPPSEAECLEYGRFLLDLLQKRKWSWRKKKYYIERLMEEVFVELPTDTLEHRMEIIWEIEERTKRGKQILGQIDEFYSELSKLTTTPVLPSS